jgi:thioredoxin reductase (NADPH)
VALTGYQPNFQFLEQAGVALSNDGNFFPQYNPDTMESNVQGLYLAGVICGGTETHKWFIENSRVHAKLITEHMETNL